MNSRKLLLLLLLLLVVVVVVVVVVETVFHEGKKAVYLHMQERSRYPDSNNPVKHKAS
jgi:hypothetical protein